MPVVVEARRLRKVFDTTVAVNGISFDVSLGECFGVLGPNGAGKTTTVRMVYGFSPLTSGELKIFGMDIALEWRRIKARIGVCQQENTLDPDLTVQQNLEVFARYFDISRQEAKERADRLLNFIALKNRSNRDVNQLSGGMIRRLVLARSLINNPELIILDEPTTGLDPQSRHQIWDKLEELKRKGLSIILTTHNMDEAAHLCDRLVIMDHGAILVQGRPGDLIKEHAGEKVIEVQEPSEALRAHLRALDVGFEDVGRRLLVYGRADDLLSREITEKFCMGGCALRMTTLEDVFLRLTGRDLRE